MYGCTCVRTYTTTPSRARTHWGAQGWAAAVLERLKDACAEAGLPFHGV